MMKVITLLALVVLPLKGIGKVYDFQNLYKSLGYGPDQDYFGSTNSQRMSVKTYIDKSDSFYAEINNYLRYYPAPYEWTGTGPEAAKKIVKDLDQVIKKAPKIPADIMLFRGMTLGWRSNKSFEVSEEFTDKAYTSTSTTYKVAEYFATGVTSSKQSKKALMAIYFNGKKVSGLLINQREDEVIIPRNQTFKIMDLKTKNNYELYLVQACSKTCDTVVNDAEIMDWWDQH